MDVLVMSIEEVLRTYTPGSYDWSWEEEFNDLETRDFDYLQELIEDIRENGQKDPILLGDDGRVWEGHHRILVLQTLGQTHIRAAFGFSS